MQKHKANVVRSEMHDAQGVARRLATFNEQVFTTEDTKHLKAVSELLQWHLQSSDKPERVARKSDSKNVSVIDWDQFPRAIHAALIRVTSEQSEEANARRIELYEAFGANTIPDISNLANGQLRSKYLSAIADLIEEITDDPMVVEKVKEYLYAEEMVLFKTFSTFMITVFADLQQLLHQSRMHDMTGYFASTRLVARKDLQILTLSFISTGDEGIAEVVFTGSAEDLDQKRIFPSSINCDLRTARDMIRDVVSKWPVGDQQAQTKRFQSNDVRVA